MRQERSRSLIIDASAPCVSQTPDPEAKLLGFLQETYEAAAGLGQRDRKALERFTQ